MTTDKGETDMKKTFTIGYTMSGSVVIDADSEEEAKEIFNTLDDSCLAECLDYFVSSDNEVNITGIFEDWSNV